MSEDKEDTNVVKFPMGEEIRATVKLDPEETLTNILKEGGVKDKSFVLIAYDGDESSYYTTGDLKKNILWEIVNFQQFLMEKVSD